MPSPPVLETPRLVLRPLRRKDGPVIQHRFPHWEIVRHLSAGIPWPYPPDGAATHVDACLGEMARGEKAHWALIPRSGPADLIGMISLWPDDGVSRSQRGFWLAPEFHRRGLMMEAAERVTAYAFLDLGWPELWFTNAQENLGSRRIKEKQGARLVDLMIGRFVGGPGPQMVWHLLREDWMARMAA
ncbi:MAG: GNAT family N-acetyltransferase [Proteobacteria bacterium]|nr:GNAT family N-acetyltransferase [Pseudomonadota bacterium]